MYPILSEKCICLLTMMTNLFMSVILNHKLLFNIYTSCEHCGRSKRAVSFTLLSLFNNHLLSCFKQMINSDNFVKHRFIVAI